MPQSGMVQRGARVYAANGCIYCHSQQVRAAYAAADIDRKWGDRRSAPRDYIFERPVFLGKARMGQDLANIGARAPKEEESPAPAAPGTASPPPTSPAPAGGASPATSPSPAASPSPASPPTQGAASVEASAAKPAVSSPPSSPAATASPSPAAAPAASPGASPAPKAPGSPAPTAAPASPSPAAAPQGAAVSSPPPGPGAQPAAAGASPAASPSPTPGPPWPVQTAGFPPMYSAAWHHVHLYSPRSINFDSNMPSYRFLYRTRRISDMASADALQLTGSDAPPQGWEVIPTYDAKCLVAYLMSLNQTHPLKDVRSAAPPAAPPTSPPPGGQPAK
jgi:Cytochrome C oxidase, mono-heme subunit/FixO